MAIVVLLENHVAVAVMSCPPSQLAVKDMLGVLEVRAPVVGVTVGALVQATETVMGWVPLIDGNTFEVAVMVPVPDSWAVTRPELEIVAMLEPPEPVPVTLQLTGVLLDEPSLKVPTANI